MVENIATTMLANVNILVILAQNLRFFALFLEKSDIF